MTKELATEIVNQVKDANPGVEGKKLQVLVGAEVYKRRIVAMHNSGYKLSEICKAIELPESKVRKILSEAIAK